MTDEQRAQVTPKTSVREMKQIRNPKPEEPEKVVTLQLPEKTIDHFTDGDAVISQQTEPQTEPEEKPEPDTDDEIVVDTSTCPPNNNSSCRRQEWGTRPEEQEAGHKECVKCWEDWKKAEQIRRAEKRTVKAEVGKEDPEPMRQELNEQPISAYGTPKRVYPEDSLIAMNGCGGGHDCSSCHLECNIRQEECYCVEAPMGNPFPCTTMNMIGKLRAEIGSRCQFVNLELAYHRVGDHEPVPCCKECDEMCEYRCERAEQPEPEQGELKPEVIDAEFLEVEEPEDKNLTDLEIARQELERANSLLSKCLRDLPDENNVYIRGMKIKVAALASLVCDMDDIENPLPKTEQPELPLLKNNDQRAAFVDAFESWPLWLETKETGERYYRYDLPDGSSMVVKVYHATLLDYSVTGLNYEERFSEGYGRHEYYLLQPGKFFKDCEKNRSALIEKLKELQKKMDMPEKGTKMYSVHEHLYYVKGRSGPLTEYCVYEGIVKGIRKVGYTELCLIAKDADGHEKMFFYPTKEIGKSVFYTPGEAALLARDKTEQYEKTWERMLEEPLRRTWEHYLVEEKG